MKLYKVTTGETEEVPESEVDAKLRSRQYTVGEGTSWPVIFHDRARLISGDQIHQAINGGGRIPSTPEEWQLATKMAGAEGTNPLLLGAQRVLSTAAFNIPDILANPEKQEQIRLASEAHPIAAGAGEVVGSLLPGAGSVAVGAGKLAARGIANRVLKAGVSTAVEGAIYGGQHGMSEFALGETDDLAESVIGGATAGGLLGAVIGGGAAAIQPVGRAVLGGAGKVFKRKADSGAHAAASAEKRLDMAFDALGVKQAERIKLKDEAVEVLNLVDNGIHPDGKKIFDSPWNINAKNAKRLEEVGEAAGDKVNLLQQQLLAEAKGIVPDDVMARAMRLKQNEMIPEVLALRGGLAPADDLGRANIDKAAEHLRANTYRNLDEFFKDRNHYKQAWDKNAANSVNESNRALERIYDRHFDDLIKEVWGPERFAEYHAAEKQLGAYLKMQKAIRKTQAREGEKFLGMNLGKDAGWGLVGGLAGGIPGGLGALVLRHAIEGAKQRIPSAIAWNAFTRKAVTQIGEVAKAATTRKAAAIESFVVGKPTRAAVRATIPLFDYDEPESKNPSKQVGAKLKALRQLAHDPNLLADRLAANIGEDLESVAPALSSALAQKGVQIAAHLLATAPVPHDYSNPSQPQFQADWEPSTYEAIKWMWRAQAALDPLSVVEDMTEGRLTVEAARTFQELYPKQYEKVTMELMESLAASSRRLTQDQLRQLSILTGVPQTQGERPDTVSRNQQAYARLKSATQRNKTQMPQTSRLAQSMATEAQGRMAE